MTSDFQGTALSASLTVNDLEKSLAWYRDVMGFTVTRTHEREGTLIAVSLAAGDAVRVLLARDDGAKGAERRKGEGFSLQITTQQDIDDVAARIKDRGGVLDSEPVDTPWGPRMFRLRDPDGFRFTISSDPGAARKA
jgi:lactoylglutathione lyase